MRSSWCSCSFTDTSSAKASDLNLVTSAALAAPNERQLISTHIFIYIALVAYRVHPVSIHSDTKGQVEGTCRGKKAVFTCAGSVARLTSDIRGAALPAEALK